MKFHTMGIMLLLFIFSLSNPIYAFDPAKSFCSDEVLMRNFKVAYRNKVKTEFRIDKLSQDITEELRSYFHFACAKKETMDTMTNKSLELCERACSRDPLKYVQNKIFGKKEIVTKVIDDCSASCESMNANLQGYVTGFKAARSDHSEVCVPQDSISDLGRSIKKIEEKNKNSTFDGKINSIEK